MSHLLRESGRYRSPATVDINTYAVFAETARMVITAQRSSWHHRAHRNRNRRHDRALLP